MENFVEGASSYNGIQKIDYNDWKKFIEWLSSEKDNNSVWRGQWGGHKTLLPSVFRNSMDISLVRILRDFYIQAQGVLSDYQHLPGLPFSEDETNIVDDILCEPHYLEWWGIAQHYGLPTPFLDWSLYPMIALFFGVDALFRHFNNDDEDIVDVWELGRGCYLSDLGEPILKFKTIPKTEITDNTDGGIRFVRGHPRYNKRIGAQGGIFTLIKPHGSMLDSHKPEERYDLVKFFEIPPKNVCVDSCFYLKQHRIQFDSDFDVEMCKSFLAKAGITHSTLYPDIEGVIKDCIYRWKHRDYTYSPLPPTRSTLESKQKYKQKKQQELFENFRKCFHDTENKN